MANVDPADRLQELLDLPESAATGGELAELVGLAAALRHLPDVRFRTRLRLEIERTTTMTTAETTAPGEGAKQSDGTVARVSGISYIHIPAVDRRQSGAFYQAVFGWELRGDPDAPSFNDGTGHVLGRWVTDVPPAEGGVLPYVFVESVDETLAKVTANGGTVVEDPYPEGEGPSPLWVATFRDPAGNTIGVWQMSPRR